MIRLFCSILLICFASTLHAQSSFNGTVVDATDKHKLGNATIVLLQAQDSILIDFTRADQDGRFSIPKPSSGEFLLLVSYPKYGEYNQHIDSDTPDNLGQIGLSSVRHLIEEVLVSGRIPVVIKGDTTEYDASSFVVEQNAKVEDLLRVLPGITVDADGKITAQGKTVEKVLVDGEEFFGDDPTLVTRNIRSDMVDKVQVFERKSEEAERTGVDDGIRQQTINVTLKEDAKRGYFGKADAAGGFDGSDSYYLGKLAFNRFQGKQKISAFGMTSNTGDISLDWQEAERFNLSDGATEIMSDGSIAISIGGDQFSYWDGRGKPQAISSGMSFMDGWRDNSHKVNVNYKYGRIKNEVEESTLFQNNLPSGQINSDNHSVRASELDRHRFNARYDWSIDSLTNITVNLSAGQDGVSVDNITRASTLDGSGQTLNDNSRTQLSNSEKTTYTFNGYLTRRMQKPGRSVSFRFSADAGDDIGNAILRSTTNLYLQGGLDSTQIIDQRKDISTLSNNWRASLSYTEPLTTQLNASISYEFTDSRTHAINNSFNWNDSNSYNVFDEEFSNDFNFNTVRNAASLSLNYKTDKIGINMTNNLRNDDLFQRNNYQGGELQRDFTTYNPTLRVSYNLTRSKTFGANFSRSNRLPSLSQIQPLRQNNDPLNIVIGNENLIPANTNSFGLSFNNYNLLAGNYTFAQISWSQNFNSIQQNVLIDPSTGIRTVRYDNLADYTSNNLSFWSAHSFDIVKQHQIKGDFTGNANYSQYFNYINGTLNENESQVYGLGLAARKTTTKGLDFSVGLSPGWSILNNSLQPEFNSSGFTMNGRADYRWHLPSKIQVYGQLNYSYEAPTEAFNEKFERVLFTPGVQKKFLNNESLILDISVKDLFNQNVGFRRFQSGNMITQNTYNTISRYFALKATWDFTSMGGKN